ncbi:MAG: hypothetical protein JWM82_3211, partial [Myxococcales bacterium]|nr:hypothetical protein [Myxococcales bacterium]
NGGVGGSPNGGAGASATGAGGGPPLPGATRCAPRKYLVCEGFESTAKGDVPTGWTREGDASIVGVDDAQSARGAHALRLGASINGWRRIATPATTFGAAHWGRIFYKVQLPAPKSNGVIHSTLVTLVGKNPQGAGDEEVRVVDTVEDPSGKFQFIYNVQPSGDEFATGSAYDWRYEDTWHCAEWHIDAANQSYHFYFDGNEVTQLAKMNGAGNLVGTGIPDVFSTLKVGWWNYQAVSAADLGFVAWIDEVAIDAARIGCAN